MREAQDEYQQAGFLLLWDNSAFRALWLARTTAYLGDFVMLTAVVLYFYDVNASPTQLGVALAARVLPAALGDHRRAGGPRRPASPHDRL